MFHKLTIAAFTLSTSLAFGLLSGAAAQESGSGSYAAVQGQKGGQDMFGAYDVVGGWPRDISTLPGAEGWTFGAGQSVFAESPDRVFYLQRGLLPAWIEIIAIMRKQKTDPAYQHIPDLPTPAPI